MRSTAAALPRIFNERYELLECVGAGGMGTVWRSFDLELEEPVALKILRADLAGDSQICAAFRREVKLARRVTHPNVARVHEFGRTGGIYYLTMEFLEGDSLATLLSREGRLPLDRVIDLAIGLARGLAAAHAVEVIHGDLKPANILLPPNRGAVLTDFGIARALVEASSEAIRGGGTPVYMAPELLFGHSGAYPCDVYAFGLLLLECLTGRLPWPTGDIEALYRHKRSGREPDLRALAPDLPLAWAALIADCLRTDPGARPEDGHALVARLTGLYPGLRNGESASSRRAPRRARSPARPPGPSLLWIEVCRFSTADPLSPVEWLTGDLISVLMHVRGLRVVTSGDGLQRAQPAMPRVRGHVRQAGDTLDIEVTVETGGSSESFALRAHRGALHILGAELACQVLGLLNHDGAPPLELLSVQEMDAETEALYLRARQAQSTFQPETRSLYTAALARLPYHPQLQMASILWRVTEAFFLQVRLTPDEMAELRATVDENIHAFAGFGEAHLAHASVAHGLDDLVTCARSARVALAHAPSLAWGHMTLADILLMLGRLPDAERRIEIGLALNPDNVMGWIYAARVCAHRGDWPRFYELVHGVCAERRYRDPWVPRLMLMHPDRREFERLEPIYVNAGDRLRPGHNLVARIIVAFALEREDRHQLIDRLSGLELELQPRHRRFLVETQCEMACIVGDLARARHLLQRLDEDGLAHRQWIEHSPLLAPLRADPVFMAAQAHVLERVDLIGEALWG